MKIELKSQFQLVISKVEMKLTNFDIEKYGFSVKMTYFFEVRGSVKVTEGSAEPVRPDFTEGSAEPFGFGRTLYESIILGVFWDFL